MAKKTILLACPTSVHFVQEYIENVLDSSIYNIFFLTWRTNINEPIWEEKKVKVITLINDNESKIKNLIKFPFRLLNLKNKLKGMDIIHYHFIDYRFTHIVDFFIGKTAKKTILTFWGSDLLRQKKKTVLSFHSLYKRADKINLMNKEMNDTFNGITNSKYSNKSIILDFGDSTLDKIIKSSNKDRFELKEYWKIPTDKITIHLGYNGFKGQQHLQMINSLNQCNQFIKEKIYIIVPLSYGCEDESYKKQIISSLNESGINYCIYDKYINQDDVATFRLTADIFLYGQITDAVSASMIEYIASDCLVIKPEWLVYSELSDAGVEMIEYKDFAELPTLLNQIISNKLDTKIDYKKNQSIVVSMKSWNVLKSQWLEMYNE